MSAAPNGKPRNADERVADATSAVEKAAIKQRRAEAGAAYEHATQDLRFTKEFWSHQEAIMRDRMETHGARFMAWLKRRAWGEFSLFAIRDDGWPATQQDAADELGIDKRIISNVARYYEARGFVHRAGRLLYPMISPSVGPPPEKVTRSSDFSSFLETWKVAHSTDFQALEVARSEVERIRKVMLSGYREWKKDRKAATNGPVSLLEIAGEVPEDRAGSNSLTPFQKEERRRRSVERKRNEAQNGPVEGGKQSKAHQYADARDFLCNEIVRMQKAYPNSGFAQPPFDPDNNPDHQNLIDLLIKRIGIDQDRITGFVVNVAANFKGLGMGKFSRERPPGSPNGPHSLGLLVNWADDYARIDPLERP